MPQAKISVNSVVGSNTDLPINVVVQLDNVNLGGEVTYNWTILDQPPGTLDVLSSAVVQSPTFTPKKEGSYLIKVVVNLGLATEQEDKVIVGIRQLKTRERVPAAGETTEADSSDGWATSMNSLLRRIDTLISDPATMVGKNNSGGVLTKGQVVRCTSLPTIKTGLPGQEVVPGFALSTGATLGEVDELLAIVEGAPDGSVSVADQGIVKVRHFGVPRNADGTAQTFAGSPAVGDPVYVSNAGAISLAAGTVRRQVGSVASSPGGAIYSIIFNGVGGADITPIDRRYVVHGAPGTLTDAVRVDGTNATGVTTPFRVKAGDAATVAFQVQGFAAGLDLHQWLSSAAAVLASITNAGDLSFAAAARRVQWPTTLIGEVAGNTFGIYSSTVPGSSFVSFSWTATNSGQTLLSPPAAPTQGLILLADATAGKVSVGNAFAAPLDLITGNTPRWRIASTGELQAQGGNRAIQNVLDPVNPQDAATKAFVDQATLPNMVINGNFNVWQRALGTNAIDCAFNQTTQTADRVFLADRWWVATTQGGTVSPGADVYAYSRQDITGEQDFDHCARLRIKTKITVWGASNSLFLAQELDRGFVARARGKKVSITVRWRKGSTMGNDGHIMLISQTGDPKKSWNDNGFWTYNNTQYGNGPAANPGSHPAFDVPGYTGMVTVMDDTTANASIGAAFTTKTAVSSVIVPVDATGMVLLIGRKLIGAAAGANEYLELSRVRLVIGEVAPVDFAFAGGSEMSEVQLCQRYCEKSNDLLSTNGVGPNTAVGSFSAAFGATLPTVPYKVQKVIFWNGDAGVTSTTKRIAIFPTDGTPQGSITNFTAGSEPTVTVVDDNAWGYHLERSGGGAAANSEHCRWHWIADYEI